MPLPDLAILLWQQQAASAVDRWAKAAAKANELMQWPMSGNP
jgi:hypothetical protein